MKKKLVWLVVVGVGLAGCNLVGGVGVNGNRSLFGALNGGSDHKNTESTESTEYLDSLPVEVARLTIPYLRQQEFPGSEIVVESVVDEFSNYTSYVASYESEGNRIYGLLTRPKIAEPAGGYKAVVFVHGYIPPQSYLTTEKYSAYVDGLAREGLVVFKIDLRGHGESEGEPNGAYFSSDYIFDVLNARASLAKLPYVNGEKIGLWGHSMAGNVVLRSMAVRPEIPAGVIWAGAVYTYADMREYGLSDGSYQPSQNPSRGRRQELYDVVGTVEDGGEFWGLVAPSSYVGELEGLVSVHHATNDPVVSVDYSRNLERIMSEAGIRYEVFEYGSGGHNMESPAFGQAMSRSVRVFEGM